MTREEIIEELRGCLEQAEGGPVVHAPADVVVNILQILDDLSEEDSLMVGSERDKLALELHRIWQAIFRFHSYEGQDRCHDIEDEFFVTVGLVPKGPPPCDRATWEAGCRKYMDGLFNKR